MNHTREQRSSAPRQSQCSSVASTQSAAIQTRSTSIWRHTGTVNMSRPQNTINSPTGAATIVNVTHMYGEESHHGASTSTHRDSQGHDSIRPQGADHEIYYYQLLTKKRGSPLWNPGPGMRLPIEYRRQGVAIGDVGIFTDLGGFDFLFNIFQPADHAIHIRGVPDSFSPLDPTQLEIEATRTYDRNTYLASSSVRTAGVNSSDLIFESPAREAAILIMPEGALTENLLNVQVIQKCIAENAMRWYEYARGTRGRVVRNGDIRVVVGWDKVCSWGIATSTCTSGQAVSLAFKVDDTAGTSRAYCWDCIGSGSGRVGPPEDEIANLRQADGASPQNQCVFVRTMNFTLAGDIGDDYSMTHVQEVPMQSNGSVRASVSSGRNATRGSKQQRSAGGTGSSRSQGGSHTCQSVIFNTLEHGVDHPATSLHKYFLDKHPNATMVITQDADWISALTDEDTSFPEPEDLCARVSVSHEVYEHNGIIILQGKPPATILEKENLESIQSAISSGTSLRGGPQDIHSVRLDPDDSGMLLRMGPSMSRGVNHVTSSLAFVTKYCRHESLRAGSSAKRKQDLQALRKTLQHVYFEISDSGNEDPRELATVVSKCIAALWVFYNSQGRRDTEILDHIASFGRPAASSWKSLEGDLEGVDRMMYHALLLILAEAYLEKYVKTSQIDVFWRDEALDLYVRLLRDGEQLPDDDSDPSAGQWRDLHSDDLIFDLDKTTTGGCVTEAVRKMNLDMARLIYTEKFEELVVYDVRKQVKEGSGTIKLRSSTADPSTIKVVTALALTHEEWLQSGS